MLAFVYLPADLIYALDLDRRVQVQGQPTGFTSATPKGVRDINAFFLSPHIYCVAIVLRCTIRSALLIHGESPSRF